MEPALVIAADPSGRFVFDARFPRGRFRDARTGRFVTWTAVRMILDETLESARLDVRALSERLRAGQITLQEWQRDMERQIKTAHLAAYALERGGLQNMTQADYGRLGGLLFNPGGSLEGGTAGQYAYLRRFARQIERGLPLDGNFLRRTDQYVKAARKTYHTAERQEMVSKGFDEAARLRFPGDSCSTTESDGQRQGCIELGGLDAGSLDFVPIEDVVMIGDAVCHANCRCQLLYRNSRTGEVFNPEETGP